MLDSRKSLLAALVMVAGVGLLFGMVPPASSGTRVVSEGGDAVKMREHAARTHAIREDPGSVPPRTTTLTPEGTVPAKGLAVDKQYFIEGDYTSRDAPEYFVDFTNSAGLDWQFQVYPLAAFIASRLDCPGIVDIGCGSGQKLVQLANNTDLELSCVDVGKNFDTMKETFPQINSIEFDLNKRGPVPGLSVDVLRRSVIISADVVEHLLDVDAYLDNLFDMSQHACGIVISSPERVLTYGTNHMGPPRNPSHVREWTLPEFQSLLEFKEFKIAALGTSQSYVGANPDRSTWATLVAVLRGRDDVWESRKPMEYPEEMLFEW